MVTETEPEESTFDVVVHGQVIRVWVDPGSGAEVFSRLGDPAPGGRQRSADA
ncbi:hypothetical protein [Streptomyces sp. NPDC050388]|uniref:hypothetical protein n=1 Tax=Streptomyces sp. NPDC050388 TaxID=3155781 RepID=UPI00343279E0